MSDEREYFNLIFFSTVFVKVAFSLFFPERESSPPPDLARPR